MAIGAITVDVLMRTAKAIRNSKKFRGELGAAGKAARKADVAFRGMGRGLRSAMGPLIGAATAAVSLRAFKGTAEDLDRVAKQSRKLGVTADNLLGLRHAAAQTAGMLDGQFDMALQRMTRRISEAAQGKGEAKDAIAELGLSAVELARMSPDQAFLSIADAMGEVSNQGDRVRLAFKFFDSEGVDLANTLAEGSDKLRGFVDESKRLRGSFDDKSLARVEAFNDAFDKLSKSAGGIGQQIVIDIAPAATEAITTLSESLADWREQQRRGQKKRDDIGAKPGETNAERANRIRRREDEMHQLAGYKPMAKALAWLLDAPEAGIAKTQAAIERTARNRKKFQPSKPPAEKKAARAEGMQIAEAVRDALTKRTGGMAEAFAKGMRDVGRRASQGVESLRGQAVGDGLAELDRQFARGGASDRQRRRQAIDNRGQVGPVDAFNSLIDANSSAGYAALRADQRQHRGQAEQRKAITSTAKNTKAAAEAAERTADQVAALTKYMRAAGMMIAG